MFCLWFGKSEVQSPGFPAGRRADKKQERAGGMHAICMLSRLGIGKIFTVFIQTWNSDCQELLTMSEWYLVWEWVVDVDQGKDVCWGQKKRKSNASKEKLSVLQRDSMLVWSNVWPVWMVGTTGQFLSGHVRTTLQLLPDSVGQSNLIFESRFCPWGVVILLTPLAADTYCRW